jgi:hypothetical protein
MVEQRAELISECNRRAADARRIAESTSDAATKAAFLELARRWLSLAGQYQRAQQDRYERARA